nr:uncharacterized mitochondrial protein AtMg00810-like [Tanacetum cinerariifolium]
LRPDIMFAVSACSWHQVTPTTSNFEAVKKIFKHLKGQPKLGLWYPKESPLVLEAYSDSDYAGENKDRKFTTGGCQFLGRCLSSWQCKKQTIMATSSTEAEYVDAANCYGRVLKIHIDDIVADLLTKAFDGPRWPYLDDNVFFLVVQVFPLHKHSNILQQSSMAALKYKEEHNKVGYLLKPTESDDYHQIIDLLSASLIRAPELGSLAILATIDKTPYTITEELVRSRLQLADDGGVADLPILEIYSGMDNLGYVTEGKLTFFKNKFSPQWRFLVHTLLYCLSTKSGSWDQFGMVSNIENAKKFLMYLRFLQTILGIETRVTRQYKVLVFSSKLFANIRLNFARHPMPLLPAMLLQAQEGGGAEVAKHAIPHPMPSPDHSPSHLPTPSRPPTSDPVASVLKYDHCSDQHETATGSFPSRDDAPLGGDFHPSPLWSSHAPPTGQPSRGEGDPITLNALSSVISTLVQKLHSLEAELHDHKKLFKDVVGKLVKKVKTLEVKLKTKKRKMVVSDSDQEDDTTQNVDLDALRALANAAVAADSDIPSRSTSQFPAASLCAPPGGPTGTFEVPPAPFAIPPGASDAPTGTSDVLPAPFSIPPGTSDAPTGTLKVPAYSLNVPAGVSSKGKSPMVEEDIPVKARTFRQMEVDRLEVLESAKFYNEADWLNIRAQVEANASLSKTLLGDDVTEDNFPVRMAALIKKKRQALAEQLFRERQNRPLTLAQQKAYMRQYVKNQSSAIYDEDSVDEVWSAVVGWEVLSTPLGAINALYRIDGSTKHFATLRQILHMVDRHDLMKLYGLVVQYYEHHPATVSGEVLSMFTDVSYPLSAELMKKMLMHKLEIDSYFVGNDLTTLASPEQTATGKDISNPFMAVMICQKSLGYSNSPMIHVLRVGLVINSPGYIVPTGRVIVPTGRYIVPTSIVIVPTGRYVVPTGRVIVATGRYVVPADISVYKQESLLCLACDYTGYSPSLRGSKDLSSVGSNKNNI